jgi:hypothetical protein
VRRYLRHLLGVGLKTPVQDWPSHCCCGAFRIDLNKNVFTTQNASAAKYFVDKYLSARLERSFPSLNFVQPEYATPAWILYMFQEHFEVLRRSLNNLLDFNKRQHKRRGERRARVRVRDHLASV